MTDNIIYSREKLIKRAVILKNENVKLKNENARLKKIIAANIEDYSCNECPYEESCDLDTVPMHDGCRMYAEIHELGIEVEDD